MSPPQVPRPLRRYCQLCQETTGRVTRKILVGDVLTRPLPVHLCPVCDRVN